MREFSLALTLAGLAGLLFLLIVMYGGFALLIGMFIMMGTFIFCGEVEEYIRG